jgi:hypothetical protein
MRFEPAASNPLHTRADLQRLVLDLHAPLDRFRSAGGGRIRLGDSGFGYTQEGSELEAWSRQLWSLAPLVAGGGRLPGIERVLDGFRNGPDPAHPDFWGYPEDMDQRLVETAAIGFALKVAPRSFWAPLDRTAREHLVGWLRSADRVRYVDNNWLFFRVLAHEGLREVGVEMDPSPAREALDRLESFALGEGWYADGPDGPCDYYNPFAFHFYGLLYAWWNGARDPGRAGRFRARAARFAEDFQMWFASDGAAIPFGRSQTYRWAQASFWGAAGVAGLESVPPGMARGYLLRNLRWWMARPIFSETGLISLGYGYPNLQMTEPYNAPGSPYWAGKALLPLLLPETHPFWSAPEAEPASAFTAVRVLSVPGFVVARSASGHAWMLNAGQFANDHVRHVAAKYARLAYSAWFGFSVPTRADGSLAGLAPDSTVAVRTEHCPFWQERGRTAHRSVGANGVESVWQPTPEIEVHTRLEAAVPWQVRVHTIRTSVALDWFEGGYAVPVRMPRPAREGAGPGFAFCEGPELASGIRAVEGDASGMLIHPDPNSNLLHPVTRIPGLTARLPPGTHRVVTRVIGEPVAGFRAHWDRSD